MDKTSPDGPITNTEHGMLVAMGEFLRQPGLLERLRQVPVRQKTHSFTPQAKLIEFLAAIMGGIEHLQDRIVFPTADVIGIARRKRLRHTTQVAAPQLTKVRNK